MLERTSGLDVDVEKGRCSTARAERCMVIYKQSIVFVVPPVRVAPSMEDPIQANGYYERTILTSVSTAQTAIDMISSSHVDDRCVRERHRGANYQVCVLLKLEICNFCCYQGNLRTTYESLHQRPDPQDVLPKINLPVAFPIAHTIPLSSLGGLLIHLLA